MTEHSDSVVLVVSEETGAISLAYDAKLYYDLSSLEVMRKLKELLDSESRKEVVQQAASPQINTPQLASSQFNASQHTVMQTSTTQSTTEQKENSMVSAQKEMEDIDE